MCTDNELNSFKLFMHNSGVNIKWKVSKTSGTSNNVHQRSFCIRISTSNFIYMELEYCLNEHDKFRKLPVNLIYVECFNNYTEQNCRHQERERERGT